MDRLWIHFFLSISPPLTYTLHSQHARRQHIRQHQYPLHQLTHRNGRRPDQRLQLNRHLDLKDEALTLSGASFNASILNTLIASAQKYKGPTAI